MLSILPSSSHPVVVAPLYVVFVQCFIVRPDTTFTHSQGMWKIFYSSFAHALQSKQKKIFFFLTVRVRRKKNFPPNCVVSKWKNFSLDFSPVRVCVCAWASCSSQTQHSENFLFILEDARIFSKCDFHAFKIFIRTKSLLDSPKFCAKIKATKKLLHLCEWGERKEEKFFSQSK